MSIFNKDSRTNNVVKISSVGTVCDVANTVMGFVYRTIFLQFLSSSYLGINGLFTNLLQILSFAELGISTAIVYRFYEPISRDDIQKVGQLMHFFKQVYRWISLVILIIGLGLFPFLHAFIKDASEVPTDINIKVIYLLYLIQTLSSYMYVYKQTLLSADQRQHILSFMRTIMSLIRYGFQIVVLALWRDYTLTLMISILSTIFMNAMISGWVTRKYKAVFSVKESLPKAEKKQIYNDTKATLCHKVGGTVLNGTDNVILSSFVGLMETGIYSNYALLISSLNKILGQLLGGFTASLGNAHVEQTTEQKYLSYRRLLFLNFWIASVCTVCLYNLIDVFIYVWLGDGMQLDQLTVITLCIQFYFVTMRSISTSYTNACGLFVRDKARPLIEALINLFVSVLLVQIIGTAGVFLGTIISHLCTVFWREPYLLFRYEFQRNSKEYWKYFFEFSFLTILIAWIMKLIFNITTHIKIGFIVWLTRASVIFVVTNVIFCMIFVKNEDWKFYISFLKKRIL